MPEPCYLCGTTDPDSNVRFCGMCGKWLCDGCRRDYPARMRAIAQEAVDRIFHH